MTPAIGPTASRWWHGSSVIPSPRAEGGLGLLGGVGHPLEEHRADRARPAAARRRAPTRSAARRAGTCRARAPAPRWPGRTSTRSAPAAVIRLQRQRVRRGRGAGRPAPWPGAGSVPASGGCQSVSVTDDGLGAQGVREHRGPGRGHAPGRSPSRPSQGGVVIRDPRRRCVGRRGEQRRVRVPRGCGVGQVAPRRPPRPGPRRRARGPAGRRACR